MTENQKKVYLCLGNRFDSPTTDEICDVTGFTHFAVVKMLKEMRKLGIVKTQARATRGQKFGELAGCANVRIHLCENCSRDCAQTEKMIVKCDKHCFSRFREVRYIKAAMPERL